MKISTVGNKLSGSLPAQLGVPMMKSINLHENRFAGPIPDFVDLPVLEELYISNNKFSGSVPNFCCLPMLKRFGVSENQITGEIPDLQRTPILEELFMQHNSLEGTIPNFSKVPKLELLLLSGNKFSGQIPDLKDCPKLTALELYNAGISGALPKFEYSPNMVYLDLSNNRFQGTIHDFRFTPTLRNLYLYGNQFTGEIPLFELNNLEVLKLSRNLISGTIPPLELPKVKYFDFSFNQLTGKIPYYMNIPVVEFMDLSHNNLTGEIPEGMKTLSYLAVLKASHNLLYGTIHHDVWNLQSLQLVDVRNNLFRDDVSVFLGAKTMYENKSFRYAYVYADNNQLYGTIDWWMYQYLQSLLVLSLSNNSITGIEELSMIIDWETVDLSNNPIMGTIPNSLSRLQKLAYLGMKGTLTHHGNDSYLPTFCRSDDPYLLSQKNDTFLCPTIRSKDESIGTEIDMNPSYYDHVFCECLPNHFGFQDKCIQCDPPCECPNGSELRNCYATPSVVDIHSILECPVSEACITRIPTDRLNLKSHPTSNQVSQCAAGYTGRVCSECAEGYGNQGRACVKCNKFAQYGALVVYPFCVAAFVLYMMHLSSPKSGKVRILVFHMQTLYILLSVFDESAGLNAMIDIGFSFTSIIFPFMSCTLGPNNEVFLLLTSFVRLPMLMIATLYFYNMIPSSNRSKVIYVALSILEIMYFQIAKESLAVFSCTLYDNGLDQWFLNTAPYISCSPASGTYKKLLGLSLPVFLIFVFTFPFAVYYIVKYSTNYDDREFSRKYGFLFLPYKPELRYWELVILARRLLFCLVIVLVPYTSRATLFLLLVLIIQISLWMQQRFQPYCSQLENRMELTSLSVIFISFYLSLLASFFSTEVWIGTLLVVINLSVLVGFLFFIAAPFLSSRVALPNRIRRSLLQDIAELGEAV
eukprot:TRINITY_DN2660_c0_g1_i2.p1 TRINITY_DN2660_c0_g1~~TRINITY_DN2660_c0_g1_i2.p1  ORF type:complete len:923 (+),score=127.78 TRINITY_DN2660_c0_g1_i2:1947-4715(+)